MFLKNTNSRENIKYEASLIIKQLLELMQG